MASPLPSGSDYPAYLDGKKPLPPGSKGAPYGRSGDVDSMPGTAATVIARDRDGYGELCRLASARQLRPDFKLAEALEHGVVLRVVIRHNICMASLNVRCSRALRLQPLTAPSPPRRQQKKTT